MSRKELVYLVYLHLCQKKEFNPMRWHVSEYVKNYERPLVSESI